MNSSEEQRTTDEPDAPAASRQLFDRHDPAQVSAMRQALLQEQVSAVMWPPPPRFIVIPN